MAHGMLSFHLKARAWLERPLARRDGYRAFQEGLRVVEQNHVFDGRYRVVAVLGDGGMARVYKAIDERLGRIVAIKRLHDHFNNQPEFVARFDQEARLAASLGHPNIIGIYDIGHDDDGAHYIVMEYVEGETLKSLIQHDAPLPSPTIAAICRQICLALDEAHRHGVIHRDITPENIYLTHEHQVKVGDFGIARALDSTRITATGMVLGSVSYFSPEQAQGQPATAQSDLYSTGIVLYEMLTGRRPFNGENALATAMKHINDEPPAPSSLNHALSPDVDAVVHKAIEKDPARRYHSGAELAAALAGALGAGASDVALGAAGVPSHPTSLAEAAAARRRAGGAGGPPGGRGGWTSRAPVPSPRPHGDRLLPLAIIVLVLAALAGGIGIGSGAINLAAPGGSHPTPTASAAAGVAAHTPGSTPAVTTTRAALVPVIARTPSPAVAPPTASATRAPVSTPTPTAPVSTPTPTAQANTATPTRTASTTAAAHDTATVAPTSTPILARTASPTAAAHTPSPTAAPHKPTPHPPTHTPTPAAKTHNGTHQPASKSTPHDGSVTLALAHGIRGFTPVNPSDKFSKSTSLVYFIAHWHGLAPGHTVTLRWTGPSGQKGAYTPSCGSACDVAYAEIFVSGKGTYHTAFYLDGHAIARHDFSVA